MAQAHDLGPVAHGGELDMTGANLARHFVQQAHLHAQFLPGGSRHGTVVEDHVLTVDEAAHALRDDLGQALRALEDLT
jgi:hypothetical protein